MFVSYCVRRFIINLLLFDILFANLILDFTVLYILWTFDRLLGRLGVLIMPLILCIVLSYFCPYRYAIMYRCAIFKHYNN